MEMFELSVLTVLGLVLVAILAGYIDTLVGGGGLLTIPALMAAGVPPIFALGTNKLQAVAGSGTASLTLLLQRKVLFRDVRWLMAAAFVGSLFGSIAVQMFDSEVLNVVIPIVLVLIALYFVFSPKQVVEEREPKLSNAGYGLSAVPAIGFYDGMFGPGTGSFLVWAGVSLRGQAIVPATITAKTLNFATNVASLVVFVYFGKVLWIVGGAMMIGQFIGASLGARALLKVDPMLLRYLVIALCLIILVWWGVK
ncbi:TSUP family transporter [Arenicella xantha]|uniref:Probable membrane transporter protein n=1 Tax=Arenicella xantha TaxID=644221 RepID=A0A395JRX7_9GAMM|nr:TSUP family transporter [Arenicella xantha]RBP51450.1 hypothetical protein DFR28_102878 [Arenicella xantha]